MNYRSFFFLRVRNKTLHNAFFAPFSEECFTICLTMFYGGKTPPASVCIMPQHYECQHQCHLQKRPHQSKPHHEHLPAFYRLHEEEGRTYKSITAEYGVSKASISKWCSEFSKECQSSPEAKEDYDNMKEMLRLKRENEELRKENLFLKKAAAFFAKEID